MGRTKRTRAGAGNGRRANPLAAVLALIVGALAPGLAQIPSPAVPRGTELELLANVRLRHPDARSDPLGEAPGDLAFWGDRAVVGRGLYGRTPEFAGFVLFDIADPHAPREISRFQCTNTGFDVSMWGDLVILSQDAPTAPPAANPQADVCAWEVASPTTPGAFAGVHLVSIADPSNPVRIASIRTGECAETPSCGTGSHTNTVVPDLDRNRLVVYSNSALESIVTVPLDSPADVAYGGSVLLPTGDGCHDLQVSMPERVAVCSSIQEITFWDLTNPAAPVVFAQFADPTIAHHHSAVLSPDGRTMVVQDESPIPLVQKLSPAADGCSSAMPGALRFYDISETISAYRRGDLPSLPRWRATLPISPEVAASVTAWCYAHYGNVLPIPPDPTLEVRNVLTIAGGGAGTLLIDFTDPSDPQYLAQHFDGGTVAPTFAASSYWYRGHLYTNNGSLNVYGLDALHTDRGLEVFRVRPGGDARGKALQRALARAEDLDHLNPQTQSCLGDCPMVPVAARRIGVPSLTSPAPSGVALWCTIRAADVAPR